MAGVRDNCNNIDAVMKHKADMFKDLSRTTVNNTTININNLTIKGSTVDDSVYKEYDNLKLNEREAREEIVKLQELIRKQRLMYRMKEVLIKQQYEYKIDNLKQQLTSNACLWEQLAESEKRENILKQELQKGQQEIATQEKIIERMKFELKK